MKEQIKMDRIEELMKKAPTDDGTLYGAVYDLYFFINLVKSTKEINEGNYITLEELKKEMEELYANTSRQFG